MQQGLRKGDELQDVFEAFQKMVHSLREYNQRDLEQLEAALAKARDAGVAAEVLGEFETVRDRLRKSLE